MHHSIIKKTQTRLVSAHNTHLGKETILNSILDTLLLAVTNQKKGATHWRLWRSEAVFKLVVLGIFGWK